MDLLSKLSTFDLWLIPLVTLGAALMGSFHCIGMCGGLMVAAGPTTKQRWSYQFGRLAGYLLIASIIFTLGAGVKELITQVNIALISSIFIGLLFIVIGIEIYRGSKFQFATKILTKIQSLSYKKGLKIKSPLIRSFTIGAFSIFLPCGFLYAAILALAVLKNPIVGVISTVAFWGGTLPAMMGAGFIIERVFRPLTKKYPKIGAMSFIVIGLLTISIRVWGIYERSGVAGGSCH